MFITQYNYFIHNISMKTSSSLRRNNKSLHESRDSHIWFSDGSRITLNFCIEMRQHVTINFHINNINRFIPIAFLNHIFIHEVSQIFTYSGIDTLFKDNFTILFNLQLLLLRFHKYLIHRF